MAVVAVVAVVAVMPVMPVVAVVTVMPMVAVVTVMPMVAVVTVMPMVAVVTVTPVMPVVAVTPVMAGPAGARVRRAGCTRLLDECEVLNRSGARRTSERSDSNRRGGHQSADQSQLFHLRSFPLYPSMLTAAFRVMHGDNARCAPRRVPGLSRRQIRLRESKKGQDTARRLGSIDGSGVAMSTGDCASTRGLARMRNGDWCC
ncbi:hypothetical protein [Sorangium sp. So ce233]|uniref:hypothetical protein n=1 Tax=Sorangium sp. So ce233 TaxID=3133290 RepID=UPI003F6170E6